MRLTKRLLRTVCAAGLMMAVGYAPTSCNSQSSPPQSQSAQAAKRLTKPPAPAPAVPAAPTSGSASPSTADGKPITQIGLWTIAWYDYSDPFLDKMKSSSASVNEWAFMYSDGRQVPWKTIGAAGADYLDPTTLLPKKLAPYDKLLVGVFRQQAATYPAAYAGTWVVDWQGDADVDVSWCPSQVVRMNKRIELTVSSSVRDRCAVFVTRVGSGGLTALRAYRKSDEQALNAGQVYTTQFLNFVRQYKIARTMDWQPVLGVPMRLANQQAQMSAVHWGGGEALWGASSLKQWGAPLQSQFRLARDADVALWLNVPPFLGAPPEFLAWWDPAVADADRAQRFGAAAKSSWKAQIASSEWDRYADAIVAAAAAEQYPANKTLYVELGNEIWNFANPFYIATGYYGSIGEAMLGKQWQHRYVYGYFSARLAEAMNGALSRAGRSGQAWTLVLAGQNAAPSTSEDALKGYKDYFTQKGADPAAWLARVGVSVTSYYQDAFQPTAAFKSLGFTADGSAYRTALQNEIKRDPVAAARRLADWTINGPVGSGMSIPNMVAMQRQHADVARRYGAKFIGDYEGGDHELGIGDWGRDASYVAMMKEFRYGAEGKRVTDAWVAALKGRDAGTIIANYQGVGPNPDGPDLTLPWVDCYYGSNCGREQGLAPVLRAVK